MSETPPNATDPTPTQGVDATSDPSDITPNKAAKDAERPVKRRFPWVRAVIALVLVILVAAAATLDQWRGPARATLTGMGVTVPTFLAETPDGPTLATQIAALETRLDALTTAIAETRAAAAPAAATNDALAQLRAADEAAAQARVDLTARAERTAKTAETAQTTARSGALTRDWVADVTPGWPPWKTV